MYIDAGDDTVIILKINRDCRRLKRMAKIAICGGGGGGGDGDGDSDDDDLH